MPDASGVFAKLRRAGELLGELDQLSLSYMVSRPHRFEVVPDRSSMTYVVTVRVDPAPLKLAVVFGDVLHNLRSSLDHLARLLVQASALHPIDGGPGSTAFPILKERREKLVDIPPGLPGEIREVLDAVQPYHATEPVKDPLWRLSELNIIDKHRLLHLTSLSGTVLGAFVPSPLDPSLPTTHEQRRHVVRLAPDAPQVFEVTPEEMYDPATLVGHWGFTVVIGEPGSSWNDQLVGVGRSILDHIAEEILPRFARFVDVDQ